jgi:uncharacterized protein YutE (UPF0331/DUF86 family)
MNQKKIEIILQASDIHRARLDFAVENLRTFFPLNGHKLEAMTDQQMLLLELLSSRFAKLQDSMGGKILDMVLLTLEEYADTLTMKDKLNKLEKLGIIEDASLWTKMRQIRNHVAHEYPDDLELAARYLNDLYGLVPVLIKYYQSFKARLVN